MVFFSSIHIYYPILFILGTLKELYVPKMLFKFQIDIPNIACFIGVFILLMFYCVLCLKKYKILDILYFNGNLSNRGIK